MITQYGWAYQFTEDHPMCRRCGRPEIHEGGLCYCINESNEKAATTKANLKADFDAQREQMGLPAQEITSAGTSVNHLPGILRLYEKLRGPSCWAFKHDVLDYGGGRFDKLTAELATRGIRNWIYDPFNRSDDHNSLVLQLLSVSQADVAFCSNMLNVIRSPAHRQEALLNIKLLTKPSAEVFFTVNEGTKDSRGWRTPKGWQSNRPTKSYLREIRKQFTTVERRGKLIIAKGFK